MIEAGGVAVANVSRGIIAELRARFDRVVVVNITAPAEKLEKRLAARAARRRTTSSGGCTGRERRCGRRTMR